MAKKVTIGGERLGAGGKMTEELHGYGSSVHDLSYIFKSSMTCGTLVPFMVELMTNGDHATIDLDTLIRTHPTVGAMFGSFKVQLDVFKCPIRYYQKELHNNKKNIGLHMENVYLPSMRIDTNQPDIEATEQLNQAQINSASLLAYLGVRGIGTAPSTAVTNSNLSRIIPNAVPLLAYWDIYANYYANLQEGIGVQIGYGTSTNPTISNVIVHNNSGTNTPAMGLATNDYTAAALLLAAGISIEGQGIGTEAFNFQVVFFYPNGTSSYQLLTQNQFSSLFWYPNVEPNGRIASYRTFKGVDISGNEVGRMEIVGGAHATPINNQPAIIIQDVTGIPADISLVTFPIDNIDSMREAILAAPSGSSYLINDLNMLPYQASLGFTVNGGVRECNSKWTMAGLGIKTYQSDLFNNWLSTEWVEGSNGVNEMSSIDVSDGTLTMDSLNLQQKIYNLLNRIVLNGGSYKDWQEAVYAHRGTGELEIPEYCGGASSEIVFDEVISTAETTGGAYEQPLGTLGGRGKQVGIKKNLIKIQANEPCFIIGIASITPRLDYSQGNRFFYGIETMNDLHKPELDGIGFQDLITEWMAAWDTKIDQTTGEVIQRSAGKQPAWIEYTTNTNQCYGNFANGNDESFMVLNRAYEHDNNGLIQDLTTYIDPTKFNGTFAATLLKDQNFWVQIAASIKMSRVMASSQIPQL